MAGLSPKLPVERDPEEGYILNKTYRALVKQNLKNLVLTAPGERIMDPEFGVGLRNYLFLNNTLDTHRKLKTAIRQQVSKYLPFVKLVEVDVAAPDETNLMRVKINYRVPAIGVQDQISLDTALKNNEFTAI